MMPGFAPGTQPSSGANTPVYAVREIIALIEGLLHDSGEKKCHLVGHDWGALVSYMVAAERPDLLLSLAALSIPYNVNLQRVILRCPRYALNSWYRTFFQLKWLADWCVMRKDLKFIDLLYRTWCPTWDDYGDRLASAKETLKAPGVLKSCLSYYRNSIFGLNRASFEFRRLFNGTINVPTLGIRGDVDGCIPEVAWELVSPKSFRNGLTLEVWERAVVRATMRKPKTATHWSARRLAKEVRLSPATVHRIWKKYGLQPHRVETFKFSTDPDFDAKLADIIGLYLDPPERALVLSVDEKSQIQALNRTQPLLPMRKGLPARMTHDYKRNGTTSLFAALEVASGKVHGRCFSRHTHVEFIAFLESLAKRYPRRELHLICDNYGTHKHPNVKAWLAKHPRFTLHFTPTSASWLNLVERWFALITDHAIRRGSFDSVKQLERTITRYLAEWNEDAKPFVWTKSPREIKRKIRRVSEISETGH